MHREREREREREFIRMYKNQTRANIVRNFTRHNHTQTHIPNNPARNHITHTHKTHRCYPFLARRLFTDNSPRTQKALKTMLYGSEGPGPETSGIRRLDVERLTDLAKGFQDYTVTTTAVDKTQGLNNAANQVCVACNTCWELLTLCVVRVVRGFFCLYIYIYIYIYMVYVYIYIYIYMRVRWGVGVLCWSSLFLCKHSGTTTCVFWTHKQTWCII